VVSLTKHERNPAASALNASQEAKENSAHAVFEAQSFNKWIDEAVDDFAKKGGFDDLPGKGRPLNLQDGDVFTGILKNANVLPPWVELRKAIVKEMKEIIDRTADSGIPAAADRIEDLNQKIRKYNRQVPHMTLQKGLVSTETIAAQYEKWL
jgi:hypothetical protein